mgnify:CR=1 FL=1
MKMWAAVTKETNGRVETQVFPMNNGIAGSDPAALKLLIAGDIQLMFQLIPGIAHGVFEAYGTIGDEPASTYTRAKLFQGHAMLHESHERT